MTQRLRFSETNMQVKDAMGQDIYLGDTVVLGQDCTAYFGSNNYGIVIQKGNPLAGRRGIPSDQVKILCISKYGSSSRFVLADNCYVVNETIKVIDPEFDSKFEEAKKLFEVEAPKQSLKTNYMVFVTKEWNTETKDYNAPSYYAIKYQGANSNELKANRLKIVNEIIALHQIGGTTYVSTFSMVISKRDQTLEEVYSCQDLTKKDFLTIMQVMPPELENQAGFVEIDKDSELYQKLVNVRSY